MSQQYKFQDNSNVAAIKATANAVQANGLSLMVTANTLSQTIAQSNRTHNEPSARLRGSVQTTNYLQSKPQMRKQNVNLPSANKFHASQTQMSIKGQQDIQVNRMQKYDRTGMPNAT